ncbi:MAG: hypothetical protein QXP22_02055 [Candidatus Anstonellales archaeon]
MERRIVVVKPHENEKEAIRPFELPLLKELRKAGFDCIRARTRSRFKFYTKAKQAVEQRFAKENRFYLNRILEFVFSSLDFMSRMRRALKLKEHYGILELHSYRAKREDNIMIFGKEDLTNAIEDAITSFTEMAQAMCSGKGIKVKNLFGISGLEFEETERVESEFISNVCSVACGKNIEALLKELRTLLDRFKLDNHSFNMIEFPGVIDVKESLKNEGIVFNGFSSRFEYLYLWLKLKQIDAENYDIEEAARLVASLYKNRHYYVS